MHIDPALVTTVGGVFSLWISNIYNARKNKEDRKAKADEIKAYLSLISTASATGIKKIIMDSKDELQTELVANTEISRDASKSAKDAFHEANNANMKIVAALKVETSQSDQADRIEAMGKDTNARMRKKKSA